MFIYGYTYTALNRAKQWENVDIINIYLKTFKADLKTIAEYNRLQAFYDVIINRHTTLITEKRFHR